MYRRNQDALNRTHEIALDMEEYNEKNTKGLKD